MGMAASKTKMRPMKLEPSQKREVRTQFGALCYRTRDNHTQILLITSRGTGRWILPKGWPMADISPNDAALQEAWEEAGVEGKVMGNSLGIYSYRKLDDQIDLPCVVAVFPIKVQRLKSKYPEKEQRQRRWFAPKKAAELVSEPELAQIIRDFDPSILPRA